MINFCRPVVSDAPSAASAHTLITQCNGLLSIAFIRLAKPWHQQSAEQGASIKSPPRVVRISGGITGGQVQHN